MNRNPLKDSITRVRLVARELHLQSVFPAARLAGRVNSAIADAFPGSRDIARAYDELLAAVIAPPKRAIFNVANAQSNALHGVFYKAVDAYLTAVPSAARYEKQLRLGADYFSGLPRMMGEMTISAMDWQTLPAFFAARGFGVDTKGPKSPVVWMPGFTATKDSLISLRTFTEMAGHRTYAPDIIDPQVGDLTEIRADIKEVILRAWVENNRRPVIVAGQSLGARNALDFTKDPDLADKVEAVIALVGPADIEAAHPMTQVAAHYLLKISEAELEKMKAPVPSHIPVFSIIVDTDGVLKNTPFLDAPHAKVTTVTAGHIGAAWAGAVLWPILDAFSEISKTKALNGDGFDED